MADGLADKVYLARNSDLKLSVSKLGRERFQAAFQRALDDDRLVLRASGIGPLAAEAITQAILQCREQPWLIDFGGNVMGDRGAAQIAKLLRRSTSLVWLALPSNGISEGGGKALAEALRTNRSLTALDLSSESNAARRNTLGRRSAKPIPSAVPAWREAPDMTGRAADDVGTGTGAEPSTTEPPAAPGPSALPTTPPAAPLAAATAGQPAPPPAAHRSAPLRPMVAPGASAPHRPWGVAPATRRPMPRATTAKVRAAPPRPGSAAEAKGEGAGGGGAADGEGAYEATAEAISALSAAISANPVLSILRLGGNAIGPDGAALLAPALSASSCHLAELALPQNGLSADGISPFAVARPRPLSLDARAALAAPCLARVALSVRCGCVFAQGRSRGRRPPAHRSSCSTSPPTASAMMGCTASARCAPPPCVHSASVAACLSVASRIARARICPTRAAAPPRR